MSSTCYNILSKSYDYSFPYAYRSKVDRALSATNNKLITQNINYDTYTNYITCWCLIAQQFTYEYEYDSHHFWHWIDNWNKKRQVKPHHLKNGAAQQMWRLWLRKFYLFSGKSGVVNERLH